MKQISILSLIVLSLCLSPLVHSDHTLDDWMAFMDACRLGNQEHVEWFLEQGMPLNPEYEKGMTPLDHALDAKQDELAIWLLELGARPYTKGKKNQALGYAIPRCDLNTISALVKAGAVLQDENLELQPLQIAIDWGRTDVIQLFKESGLNPLSWNSEHTPLSYAAMKGQVEVCRYLLNIGANVNEVNGFGGTPLMMAAYRDLETVQVLLDAGAAVNAYEDSDFPTNALINAVRYHYTDVVEALLQAGADPNALENRALKYADLLGNQEIYDLLVRHGAEILPPYSFLDLMPSYVELAGEITEDSNESSINPLGSFANALYLLNEVEERTGLPKMVSVGIISTGEDVEDIEYLLSANLSENNKINMVERDEISRILKEQNRSRQGVINLQNRLGIGKLLGADALVMLDKNNQDIEMQVVSSATGLVIGYFQGRLDEKMDEEKITSVLGQRVLSQLGLLFKPLNEIKVITFPQIVSSRPTEDDDILVKNITRGLSAGLGLDPSVYFVNRDDITAMLLEKSLNESEKDLFNSSWLIAGVVDFLPKEENNLTVTLTLKSPNNNNSIRITHSGSASDLSGIIHLLKNDVIKAIDSTSPEIWSAEDEALEYVNKAKRLMRQNQWKQAFKLIEISLALDPLNLDALQVERALLQKIVVTSQDTAKRLKQHNYRNKEAKLFVRRIPTLLAAGNVELSVQEYFYYAHAYLQNQKTLLSLEDPVGQSEGKGWRKGLGSSFNVAFMPLTILDTLSLQNEYWDEAERLKREIREVLTALISLAKRRQLPIRYEYSLREYLKYLPYLERDSEALAVEYRKWFEEISQLEPPFLKHDMWRFILDSIPYFPQVNGKADTAILHVSDELIKSPHTEVRLLGYYLKKRKTRSSQVAYNCHKKIIELAGDVLASENDVLITSPRSRGRIMWISNLPDTSKNGVGIFRQLHPPQEELPEYSRTDNRSVTSRSPVNTIEYVCLMRKWTEIRLDNIADSGSSYYFSEVPSTFHPDDIENLVNLLERATVKVLTRLNGNNNSSSFKRFKNYFRAPIEEAITNTKGIEVSDYYPRGKPYREQEVLYASLKPQPFYTPHLNQPNPYFTNSDMREYESDFRIVSETNDGVWILLNRYGFIHFQPNKADHDIVFFPQSMSVYQNNFTFLESIYFHENMVAFELSEKQGLKTADLVTLDLENEKWKIYDNPIFKNQKFYNHVYRLGTIGIALTDSNLYYAYQISRTPDEKIESNVASDMSAGIIKIDRLTKKSSTFVSNRRLPPESPPDSYFTANMSHSLRRVAGDQIAAGRHIYNETTNTWRKRTKAEVNQFDSLYNSRVKLETDNYEFSDLEFLYKLQKLIVMVRKKGQKGESSDRVRLEIKCDLSRLKNYKPPSGWNRLRPLRYEYNEKPRLHLKRVSSGIFMDNNLGFYFIPLSQIEELFENAVEEDSFR
jgi:ankyrin repeat protein